MGAICCKEEESINPFSKKLMQINFDLNNSSKVMITQEDEKIELNKIPRPSSTSSYDPYSDHYFNSIKNSFNSFVNVYDIEDESGMEIEANFRIFKEIDGLSQLNFNNSLYLCGASMSHVPSGAYLVRFDPTKSGNNTSFLINSINHHFYPTLLGYRTDFILVIGGYKSKYTEIYNIKTNKWKNLPEMPEERFRCSAISDEITDYVYLFGGYNAETFKNCSSILRLNMKNTLVWETLIVKSNSFLLARNSTALVKFDKATSIFILGGKNNEDGNTDYIVEFDINTRNASLSKKKLCALSSFSQPTGADLNKADFFLYDERGNIHKITRTDFNISMIEFRRIFGQGEN